jgi:hypothetical protein
MEILYDEVIRRFPEVRISEGDEDLPYVVVSELVYWLSTLTPADVDPALIERVVAFKVWCTAQPRGNDAGDDILTIYTVSFFEKLFRHEATRVLIPHLVKKSELLQNQTYLKSWVDEKDFRDVLSRYR